MKRRHVNFLFCVVALLILSARRDPALSAEKVYIGYSAISAATAPLWVANDRGLLKKYGLDAELIYLAGGSRVVLGMESDSIQAGLFNDGAAVEGAAVGSGQPVAGQRRQFRFRFSFFQVLRSNIHQRGPEELTCGFEGFPRSG